MPAWAGVNVDAFMAGFAIAEFAMAFLFAFLITFVVAKKLLNAAM